jgi:hypothetical protein
MAFCYGAVERLAVLHGYHAPMHLVATQGVHCSDPGEDLDQHVRNGRWVILVEGICKDSRDSQVGMLPDKLHRCHLGLELGVNMLVGLDADPGGPATAVRELQEADNVVEPAGDLIQRHTVQMLVCVRGDGAQLVPSSPSETAGGPAVAVLKKIMDRGPGGRGRRRGGGRGRRHSYTLPIVCCFLFCFLLPADGRQQLLGQPRGRRKNATLRVWLSSCSTAQSCLLLGETKPFADDRDISSQAQIPKLPRPSLPTPNHTSKRTIMTRSAPMSSNAAVITAEHTTPTEA